MHIVLIDKFSKFKFKFGERWNVLLNSAIALKTLKRTNTDKQQLGNLLSLCKKVAGAYSFYLFFEILWKTAIGKFLRDQNIMVQWFGSFNHGYLFVGILTLVQM